MIGKSKSFMISFNFSNKSILHKEDAEVDHIVPFSKWWEIVYENTQLVHWRCNQQKGNRVDES